MATHPIYRQIGAAIQQRRKQLRFKQEKVASDLGISRGSLANIETGRQSVLVHQLYRFAEVLDLSPTDLLPATLAATTAPVDDWSGKMPPGLKPSQQQQIARLLDGSPINSTTFTRVSNAKTTKR
jgi:transcriptional regulator with XRE-family HTH domain